jgi:hypothetical protein
VKHIKTYESAEIALSELSSDRELPMVTGIAEIVRMVRDPQNRNEIAKHQVEQFKKEGIRFRYMDFLKLCGVE